MIAQHSSNDREDTGRPRDIGADTRIGTSQANLLRRQAIQWATVAGRPPELQSYDAAVATRTEEIRAETPGEFAAVLHLLRTRSGVGVTEVSRRSGIARSQVYELVSAKRTSLPKRSGQIVALALACGLPPDKITVLTAVWERLADQERRGAAPAEPPASTAGGGQDDVNALADQVMDRVIKVAAMAPPAQISHRTPLLVLYSLLGVVAMGAVFVIIDPSAPPMVYLWAAVVGVVAAGVVLGSAFGSFRAARALWHRVRALDLHYRWYCWRLRRQAARDS